MNGWKNFPKKKDRWFLGKKEKVCERVVRVDRIEPINRQNKSFNNYFIMQIQLAIILVILMSRCGSLKHSYINNNANYEFVI